jgi:S1-C subfamily serine protease
MTGRRTILPFVHNIGVLLLGGAVLHPVFSKIPETETHEAIEKAQRSLVSIRCLYHADGRVFSRVGSGFVVCRGIVATRRNVVEKADSIFVTLTDGRLSSACLFHDDIATGLALLTMHFEDVPPLAAANSSELAISKPVTVLGNSLGIFPSVSLGTFTGRRTDGLLEIQCLLPPGNSGGPVLDEAGKLVGMVIGRVHREQTLETKDAVSGLAMPVESIRDIVKQITRGAKPGSGWVGLSVVDVEDPNAGKSVQVIRLVPGGPAEQAGISSGDTIVQINGVPVQCARAMAIKVQKSEPNSSISFSIQKGRTLVPKTVKVGRMP